MSQNRGSGFRLVEIDGYSERDLYEGDDLEEIAEFLATKTGDLDVEPLGVER